MRAAPDETPGECRIHEVPEPAREDFGFEMRIGGRCGRPSRSNKDRAQARRADDLDRNGRPRERS